MPRTVICISHATGSGGSEIGRVVAERLGLTHVDEEIVAQAAARGGFEAEDVADEERRKSVAARILGALSESSATVAAFAGAPPIVIEDQPGEIRGLIREAIELTAARGDVVITAHAASHALEAGPNVLRVLVIGSAGARAQRVSARAGIDLAKAERTIKDADAGRRDYLKRFYGIADELPTQYDLVVNTDGISVDDAAALVAYTAEQA